jgi:hypothetical protein
MESLSENFNFGKAPLDLAGKSGLQTAFSKAFPKTNRVLGKALYFSGGLPHIPQKGGLVPKPGWFWNKPGYQGAA